MCVQTWALNCTDPRSLIIIFENTMGMCLACNAVALGQSLGLSQGCFHADGDWRKACLSVRGLWERARKCSRTPTKMVVHKARDLAIECQLSKISIWLCLLRTWNVLLHSSQSWFTFGLSALLLTSQSCFTFRFECFTPSFSKLVHFLAWVFYSLLLIVGSLFSLSMLFTFVQLVVVCQFMGQCSMGF